MAARVLAVRPRPAARPRLVPVPSSPSVPAVRVGWDKLRGLDVGVCSGCAESFASSRSGDVDDWADAHRCDADLVALLALVTRRRAA